MEYKQVRVIGGRGAGPEQFTGTLRGVWIDRHNRLYAAGDSQVKVFDGDGALLRQWRTARPATAVAADENGYIYAGEQAQIEIFDGAGRLTSTWRDAELLGEVTAIGFAGGAVLAADAGGRCIRRYDRAGKLLNVIGKDNRTKGFLIPNGALDFAVDAAGLIHVANPGKHRVERYSLDGRLLGHIGRFDGLDPAGFAGCCNPTNVAIGASGRTYTTEKAEPRAKLLDADGKLLSVIATTVFDRGCKNMDVAVDSRGRVYVADTVKLHIIVFEPATGQGEVL